MVLNLHEFKEPLKEFGLLLNLLAGAGKQMFVKIEESHVTVGSRSSLQKGYERAMKCCDCTSEGTSSIIKGLQESSPPWGPVLHLPVELRLMQLSSER